MELPLNESGAPSTLRWLEKTEAEYRDKHAAAEQAYLDACADSLHRPASKDGQEFEKIEAAAKRQLDAVFDRLSDLQKLLREYTKAVPEEKRDATEKLTRTQVERFLESLCISLIQYEQTAIDGICTNVLACKVPEDVYKLIADKRRECMGNAVENAIREGHLPDWFLKPLEILA